MNILTKIIEQKQLEIQAQKAEVSVETLSSIIKTAQPCLEFFSEIQKKISQQLTAIIAEVKFASPSRGTLRKDLNPAEVAQSYQSNGATCLSILTDQKFFQGSLSYLPVIKEQLAKTNSSIPLLRKDFIIDEYQLLQSKAMGADAVLLIVACLDQTQLNKFAQVALDLGLDVLIEVHTEQETSLALEVIGELRSAVNQIGLGINNRNLANLEVNLETSTKLLASLRQSPVVKAKQVTLVAESGIESSSDLRLLGESGAGAFLVGSSLMEKGDPGNNLKELLNG